MVKDAPLPPGEVTGNAPFYSKPEPLNPQEHGKLGLLNDPNPYDFGQTQHFVPVLATEFLQAACSYPIIFAGEEFIPLAVMGVNDGENLFYEDGVIKGESYLPAYMRRYPFIVAADQTGERMVVCIDRPSRLIGENPDHPFFVNGELSDYSKHCIQFCENFEMDRGRTTVMIERLKELDLFALREATFQPPTAPGAPPAEPQKVAAFMAVSEEKLNALPADVFLELRDKGYLLVIYAHLTSLSHWDRLVGMSITRRIKAQEQKAKKN